MFQISYALIQEDLSAHAYAFTHIILHNAHTQTTLSILKYPAPYPLQIFFNSFTAKVAIMRLLGSAPKSHLCDLTG
jgi:hypothetical protein